jgi:hypothetical protein
VRNTGLGTRFRARLLRTFRGRRAEDATWVDEAPVSAGAPESFRVAGLVVDVTPKGLKAAGINPASIIYRVRVGLTTDPRAWSSSYGFPPREASARRAADAALDELHEISLDPTAWLERITQGMSPDEAEAMEDSPAVRLDRRAAEWVGPELEGLREERREGGSWLPSAVGPEA